MQWFLDDLRASGLLERVDLPGLTEAEVGELLGVLGAPELPPGFAAALHAGTAGNPFLVEEVVRHLRESGEEEGGVEGVREITARRLARLTPDAQHALLVASVIGPELDADVLERVGPVTGEPLHAALAEAVAARVLRETGRDGRYAFAHALVRTTIYDGIAAPRRARLHGRVGEAIAELRAAELDPHLPQLAFHFAHAAALDPARAIDSALAAARRADRLLAWEQAAQHYRAALRARELAGAPEDRVRGDVLLALGESEQRSGDDDGARASFLAAAETARGLGDPSLLALAALGFAGPWSIDGGTAPAALLAEALTAMGDADTPLRARLLARLAPELSSAGDLDRSLSLTEDAVAVARRLGDPHTLAACLEARRDVLWRPDTIEERRALAGELRRLADETGDAELELEGAGWTVVDLLEIGDVQGADIQIAAAGMLAEALHHPLWLWWTSGFRCARAQLDGDFAAAEELAIRTLAIGQRARAEHAVRHYAQALFTIRREQGRLEEMEDAVRQLVARTPGLAAWHAALALLLAELGREEEARAEFEALAGPGFGALPADANWAAAVAPLAEVCGRLGDRERAQELCGLLAPYAERNVVVGRASTCHGSASRLLGILAATTRDWDAAEGHFEAALALHERMGSRPWQARTLVAWAEMVLARRAKGDKARARELLADAILLADAAGMTALGERARALVPAGKAGPGGAPVGAAA